MIEQNRKLIDSGSEDLDQAKLDDVPMIKLIEVLIEQRRLEELDKQLDGLLSPDSAE